MLVERYQDINLVTRAQYFARAEAHLENTGPAGDGGRDGHVRHDILFRAPG